MSEPKTRDELSKMSSKELGEYIAEFSTDSFVAPLIDVVYELHRRMAAIEAVNPTVYTFDKIPTPIDPVDLSRIIDLQNDEMGDC